MSNDYNNERFEQLDGPRELQGVRLHLVYDAKDHVKQVGELKRSPAVSQANTLNRAPAETEPQEAAQPTENLAPVINLDTVRERAILNARPTATSYANLYDKTGTE